MGHPRGMTFMTPTHFYVAQRCHACGRVTGGCIPTTMPPSYPPYSGIGTGFWGCRGGGPGYPTPGASGCLACRHCCCGSRY
jgi:hypothetical protein